MLSAMSTIGKAPTPASSLVAATPFLSGEAIPRPPTPECHKQRAAGERRRRAAVRADAGDSAAPVPAVDSAAPVPAVGGPMARRGFVVMATLTVQRRNTGLLTKEENDKVVQREGKSTYSPGERLVVDLVCTIDPASSDMRTIYAEKISEDGDTIIYSGSSIQFTHFFNELNIGAVLVENEHNSEMYLSSISLQGLPQGEVVITCNSWIQPKSITPEKRTFFTSESTYLPFQTPVGMQNYRGMELQNLRGNGEGEREYFDRIYDYDTYNDLGDPDSDINLKRPVLGGQKHPYPRRCRTGRPPTKTDPESESRVEENYVPRDERFSDAKQLSFSSNKVYSVLESVLPTLDGALQDPTAPFPSFTAIDSLYNERRSSATSESSTLKEVLPDLYNFINKTGDESATLRFDRPALFEVDRFGWLKDEEFARQTLAGLNPCSIQLVTEWPLKSNLDPAVYGSPESGLTTELVQSQIGSAMTVEEAVKQKKLFIIDYHDAFLPYVNRVRDLGSPMYGSRTLFFLMPDETLKPVAIELTRPPSYEKPRWREVYTPNGGGTAGWLWQFAKAHALANDSAYHQLISHWLRTHACTEPYVIAMYRNLSEMHPIHRLLRPHFRYTLEINAIGRATLISADGTTETSFNAGKYSMEISSDVYKQWRFDTESLPAELVKRGMATWDRSAPHGVRLTIQDYPYANDGLLIWDSIKEWVSNYVNHYYPSWNFVMGDHELQMWWSEVQNQGHEDKRGETWWPKLQTPEDLIEILTTIIWVASGHHAAVNFGQYAYAGYMPNRPTIARNNMPTEDPNEEDWDFFVKNPEVALLQCFPSMIQTTRIMAVMYVLSTHSPDEEYIGEKAEPSWVVNPTINAAFERFSERVKEIEKVVEDRNGDENLKNRCGAGIVPYELLKPFSQPGVTSMGVPNSISI